MQIIIIGAGLGGLTAALVFARIGHQVHVLEKREVLAAQGGSIMIRPGASRVLHSMGLKTELEAISDWVPTTLIRHINTGEIVLTYPVEASETAAWGTTRKDLMLLLQKRVSEMGVILQFGKAVIDVMDKPGDTQPYAKLLDGGCIFGDVILVADGIKSQLRKRVLAQVPNLPEPLVSGTTFYGFCVDATDLMMDSQTNPLTNQTNVNIWKGNDSFVVTRYNSKSNQVSFLFATESENNQTDLWDEHGDINCLRKRFSTACKALTDSMKIATSCDRWRLAQVPPLPAWRSAGGRLLLLGDSAHAMHPNAGQGYSQTVEDIGLLAFLIEDGMSMTDLSRVTGVWQEMRMPRVERMQKFSEWKTRWYLGQEINSPLISLKSVNNAGNLRDTIPDMYGAFQSPEFLKWVLDFDVTGEMEKRRKL